MEQTIGEKISPVLIEIEDTLWEYEAREFTGQPKFTQEGFRAAVKIFMSVVLDKMYDNQESLNMSQEDRGKEATKLGETIHKMLLYYTKIDTKELYK